tara:strand:+ start:650 stop:1483 length:834 start_codon:yes stop_codon:yes gene_type:complete
LICFNGKILDKEKFSINYNNRYFLYGDGFFETIKYVPGKILFWEEHYFRLMGSLCMLRFQIPSYFNESFFSNQINLTLEANALEKSSARIKILFYRESAGLYKPSENKLSYIIYCEPLKKEKYCINEKGLIIDVFSEYKLGQNSLNNIKTSNRLINVLAKFYNEDHQLDDCVFINQSNNIVESTSGNIFILLDNQIITPTLKSGCIDGVMRKYLLKQKNICGLSVLEKDIIISDLLNAKELFFSNVINCVSWVAFFRGNVYESNLSKEIIKEINNLF